MRRCPKCDSFFSDDTEVCPYEGTPLLKVELSGTNTRALAGTTFAERYEVLHALGEGGMGIVYQARDTQIARTVAIKVLHREIGADEKSVRRFFSEARVLSSLSHPHIIELYDFGQSEDGLLYIAMEMLSGSPADVLIRDGALTETDATTILTQVASALGEAHLQGVIHRDLKPPNIFVRREPDGSPFVTVLDFGIAKISGAQNLTATGKVMGTPCYMAPEQIGGKKPDPRIDIYALGILGYELLCGHPPFQGDNPVGILFKHLNEAPVPLTDLVPIDPGLSDVILRFLAKNPDDRPRNILEVRNLLSSYASRPLFVVGSSDETGATLPVDAREAERRASVESPDRRAFATTQPSASPASRPRIPAVTEGARSPSPPSSRGLKIALWIGAALVAIFLATVLAIAVFLALGGWSMVSKGFQRSSELEPPPAISQELATASVTAWE